MPINVPPSAQGAFSRNMESGEKIQLPFPAPAFYILNGDAKFEEMKNILYYGGWACSVANVKTATDHWENLAYPIPGFAEKDLKQKTGSTLSLISRSLIVAPIGFRYFSTIKGEDGKTKRFAPFTKGARPALQVLVYLGYMSEQKQIVSWAPAMLTAKGWQVNHIQKSFSDWKKAITPFMKEIAPGMPADVTNLFWMHIGTFGNVANFEQHGESSISPVSAYIPENLTADLVEKRYVGDQMAEFMASTSEQAQEWFNAYKNLKPEQAVVEDNDGPIAAELPPEDDIPF